VTPDPLRVAVWQCRSHPLDVEGNLERLAAVCRQLAGRADVVVTPEMFVTGYDIPLDDVRRLAEPADGAIARTVAEISRQSGVAVAYGYPELDGELIYNAAQLVEAGERLANHRKLHLFTGLDSARFAPGDRCPEVVELRGHRVAMLICYDVEFPEAVRAAASGGAEAVLVPTANMVGYEAVSTVLVPARAYENGCYVAYANYCGTEGGQTYAGLSTVAGPDGAALALAGDDEGVEIVSLHVGDVVAPDYLADRRIDLFGDGRGRDS